MWSSLYSEDFLKIPQRNNLWLRDPFDLGDQWNPDQNQTEQYEGFSNYSVILVEFTDAFYLQYSKANSNTVDARIKKKEQKKEKN